uniref:Polyprotein n=1 Tax=Cannabis sativa TaxID=3483 RepID=A0A803Q8S8_CANSA
MRVYEILPQKSRQGGGQASKEEGGVLDFDCYKITLEDGNLKVVRGAFVAMKGHARDKALQGLVKHDLLKGVKNKKLHFGEHCVLGKKTRVKFDIIVLRTKGTLDYIYTVVWGPSKNASLGGKRCHQDSGTHIFTASSVSRSTPAENPTIVYTSGNSKMTKPVSTPLVPHFKLSAKMSPNTANVKKQMVRIPYANVGALMYAMVCNKPDIFHILLVRYIGLKFKRVRTDGKHHFRYVDFDYAGDLDKRRSSTSYVFTVACVPVCWRSTLQSTVALFTTEAEYMAITEAFKEVIWLLRLTKDLGHCSFRTNGDTDFLVCELKRSSLRLYFQSSSSCPSSYGWVSYPR